jgi:hypothetical protein
MIIIISIFLLFILSIIIFNIFSLEGELLFNSLSILFLIYLFCWVLAVTIGKVIYS